jgi:hypothetical protein
MVARNIIYVYWLKVRYRLMRLDRTMDNTVDDWKDMCRVDSQVFDGVFLFLNQIIVLAACLQVTGSNKLYQGGCKLYAKIAWDWRPDAFKLYPSGGQSHTNCTRVAASRRQITADFIPVVCDWRPCGYNACDWRPLLYSLNETGRKLHTIFACASCQYMQSRQFFESTLSQQNNYLN